MQSAMEVLPKTIAIIITLTAYSTIYFGFVTMKLLLNRINMGYEVLLNNEELHLFEESEKQSKLYVYVILGFANGYGLSILVPCIVKLCLYFYGILDDNNLQLILPVENVTKAGVKYFCSLIYQIIAFIAIFTVAAVSFSGYLIFVLFACFQFRVLISKIQRPFRRNSKYFQRDLYFRTSQEEWDWIIDIINSFKNVT
ncbi:PREDICTED: uncharacterized protein LOC107073708, partial [Polistes dominula]|uniref:Uncharacterized protein LOC107073708 n=1 Tax=Polistes dominula TaxID=743375 RepID=A0ABM1JBQ1_POLDO